MLTSAWLLCLAAPLGAQGGDPPGAAAPSKTLDNGAMRVTLSQGREAPGWFIAATKDERVLALGKKSFAFGIAWTYFHDLPRSYNGAARGAQCCSGQWPMIYAIGPAKLAPLELDLADLTGDAFYRRMAEVGAGRMNKTDQPPIGNYRSMSFHSVFQTTGLYPSFLRLPSSVQFFSATSASLR
jgi:hypothetical protein